MDVSGADAAQKLSILASILFNQPIDFKEIPKQGIDGLAPVDGRTFKRWGMTVKPLVMARVLNEKLALRVAPALVSESHPLAWVREENNALSLYLKGREEPITKIGKGAGAIPTARSIVRDILDVSRKARAYMVDLPGFFSSKTTRPLAPGGSFEASWYVRFTVSDSPGVLGKITSVLGDFDLSILKVLQETNVEKKEAHVLLELKKAPGSGLEKAADLISRFPFVKDYFSCMIL
jgi:homoserine dehydrogenase